MTIQFETEDGCTVLMPTILLEPEQARQALSRDRAIRRSHLYPLVDAVAHFACSWLMVPQGSAPFDLPRDPWIISIGDDFHFAWGPRGFPAEALDAAIKAADHCVLITSGPDQYPYKLAATFAVKKRQNELIIETLPHQKDAWQKRIEHVRGSDDLPMFYCFPAPPTKGAA